MADINIQVSFNEKISQAVPCKNIFSVAYVAFFSAMINQ